MQKTRVNAIFALFTSADQLTRRVVYNEVRLNGIDLDRNTFAPGEAGAAAEIEHYLGSTLKRAPSGASADYIIDSDSLAGARIDFKLTPDTFAQADKINTYFDRTIPKFSQSFADKLANPEGVDMMPFDTRFLSAENKKKLLDFVDTLPKSSQKKLFIQKIIMSGTIIIAKEVSFDVRTIDFIRIVDILRSFIATSSTAKKLIETVDDFGMNMICADELNSAEFKDFARLMKEVAIVVGDKDKEVVDFLDNVCSQIDGDERIL